MTTCTTTTTATQVCVSCPAVPYQAPQPERQVTEGIYGWNASAYSVTRLDSPCYTEFTVGTDVVGVVLGLANERTSSHPVDVPHGFYFLRQAARTYWLVSERAAPKTSAVVLGASDVFRIERRGQTITYWVNNRRVYTSATPSRGSLVVVSCLYASNDEVG